MKVRKELLRIGKHHARGGVLDATKAWCLAKVDQTKKLLSKGIKIPISWGHTAGAMPLDPTKRKDEAEYHGSKFKAGDLLDLELVGDRLFFEAEIPAVKRIDDHGNLIHEIDVDGQRKEGAISEVSAGFENWTDGTGQKHDDALIHVALCPLPVSAGQSGFEQVAAPKPMLLSTSTWFGAIDPISSNSHSARQLATESDMDKPETEPEAETKPDKEGKTQVDVKARLTEIGKKFRIGLPDQLPSDPEAALELLYVAACAIAGPQEDQTLTPEPIDGSNTGSIMLSTAVKDKSWAGITARNLDKSTREALKSRIEQLKSRGLDKTDYDKLVAQVPRLELSLNAKTGMVLDTTLHDTLTVLERNMPSRKELATGKDYTEEPAPGGNENVKQAREQRQKEVDAQLKNWGVE